jgi:hypothetical protein
VVSAQCCFWIQGGGVEAAVTFWKRLGIAASVAGDHVSDVITDIDVNKISYVAGPRCTYSVWTYPITVLGQCPATRSSAKGSSAACTASMASILPVRPPSRVPTRVCASDQRRLQLLPTRNWGLRVLETDYVSTALPNNAADRQNDLRLSFGVTYHLGSVPPPWRPWLAR